MNDNILLPETIKAIDIILKAYEMQIGEEESKPVIELFCKAFEMKVINHTQPEILALRLMIEGLNAILEANKGMLVEASKDNNTVN
jgi:hypothetical protein